MRVPDVLQHFSTNYKVHGPFINMVNKSVNVSDYIGAVVSNNVKCQECFSVEQIPIYRILGSYIDH